MSKPVPGPYDLALCPFDGAPADVEHLENGRWSVGCRNEECIGYISMATFARKAEAIAAWNTRTADQHIERLTSALEAMVLNDCDCPPCVGSMAPAEHYLGLAREALSLINKQGKSHG